MSDPKTSNREAELPAIPRIGTGDLLGCPFCGYRNAKLKEIKTRGYTFWTVECQNYKCGANIGFRQSMMHTVDAWNNRQPNEKSWAMRDPKTFNREAELPAIPRIGTGDLLGCPWCGEQPEYQRWAKGHTDESGHTYHWPHMLVHNCKVYGALICFRTDTMKVEDTKEALFAAWNARK